MCHPRPAWCTFAALRDISKNATDWNRLNSAFCVPYLSRQQWRLNTSGLNVTLLRTHCVICSHQKRDLRHLACERESVSEQDSGLWGHWQTARSLPQTVSLDGYRKLWTSVIHNKVEWKTLFGLNTLKVALHYQNTVREIWSRSVRCKDPRKIVEVLEIF